MMRGPSKKMRWFVSCPDQIVVSRAADWQHFLV